MAFTARAVSEAACAFPSGIAGPGVGDEPQGWVMTVYVRTRILSTFLGSFSSSFPLSLPRVFTRALSPAPDRLSGTGFNEAPHCGGAGSALEQLQRHQVTGPGRQSELLKAQGSARKKG